VSDLVQLYRRLLRARSEHPPAESPPTVGDVYQRLVPYRTVRAELGFSELKEYEHVLMRLLSGENGYVTLDSDEATAELRRELESPNPILGVYRDYAGVGVSIREDATDPLPQSPPSVPSWIAAEASDRTLVFDRRDDPVSTPSVPSNPTSGVSPPAGAGQEPAERTASSGERTAEPPRTTVGDAARPAECWACRSVLPTGRSGPYCPACGSAQHPTLCHSCGGTIQPSWRFCIDCGTRRRVGEACGPVGPGA
jgi:hypothetical protein